MKTSNKLLLSALILFLVSIGIYNCALRAEYLTGSYKNPYNNYTALNINNFDEIQVNAASQMHIKIISGDSKVYVNKTGFEQMKFTQVGKKLIINVVYPANNRMFEQNDVIISCPKLISIKAQSFYMVGSKKIIENDTTIDDYCNVNVQNFKLDSLLLQQDNTSAIRLKNNKIGMLTAIVGNQLNANPELEIKKDNTIQKADLQINQKGRLELNNVYIPQLKYHFSDSSEVTLSGIALRNLNH